MPLNIEDILRTAGSAAAGLGIANWQDQRQLEQQRALTGMQVGAQKELGQFNQKLAYDMWLKTNYAEQRKQMEKAGLNVGLMYKGAGGGGTTAGGSAGSVTGGSAAAGSGEIGMGIQLGMQNKLMQAQIENVKADTAKKNVEASKIGGVDTTEAQGRIANLAQQTANAAVQKELMELDKNMKQVDARIKTETEWDAIEGIRNYNKQARESIDAARRENRIGDATADELINQINTASIEQGLRIKAQKLGLIKTGADIKNVEMTTNKIANDINMALQGNMREWDKMSQKDKEIAVQQIMAKNATEMQEFNTSTAQEIRQWTGIITDVLGTVNPIKPK